MRVLLGYNRFFDNLAEAEACANSYWPLSHLSRPNLDAHLGFMARPRISDYPILFYLSRLVSEPVKIFDLGGNVGNLFYCYRQLLQFDESWSWTVFDLAETISRGRQLAMAQGTLSTLSFTGDLSAMDGADIVLASGSLHYFEDSLPSMIGRLASRPAHILLNRTPLVTGPTVVTVQDVKTLMHGCKLYNKSEIIEGMVALGYSLMDEWQIPELRVRVPLYPDRSALFYTGLYFRRKP